MQNKEQFHTFYLSNTTVASKCGMHEEKDIIFLYIYTFQMEYLVL